MFAIRDESPLDLPARERLLDSCFGPSRFAKTCERLRAGRLPAENLSLVVDRDGDLLATVRLWNVRAGSAGAALMLGPIAVDPKLHGCGIGSRLMHAALDRSRALGHRAVLLVGDAPYYVRFGFADAPVADLVLPGPYDRARFLGLDLVPGALAGASGLVTGTGRIRLLGREPDGLDLESASWNRMAA